MPKLGRSANSGSVTGYTVVGKTKDGVTLVLPKGGKSYIVGRNAATGQLTSVATAHAKPSTHIVERMPKAGRGDTKK